jgi:wyosine [tRNA(Phe)-imidazoG37] synthetase (radical SAM superfamily)
MYTYGPVPSRRMGRSLGVSPIPPKTCTYSYVYCQLGRTSSLTCERQSFCPGDDLLDDILRSARKTNLDYITFVGDGEPTPYAYLGWLTDQTRSELEIPVAVITNGSLLPRQDVRDELLQADVVIPTLDAGRDQTFARINRAHPEIHLEEMLQDLTDFSYAYQHQLWIEVMVVRGVNDSQQELLSLKAILERIYHQRVYLLTPIRPPAESSVRHPDSKSLPQAQYILGGSITLADLESGDFGLSEFSDSREATLEIGLRHPLRREKAERIATLFSEQEAIKQMLNDRVLLEVEHNGEPYSLPGRFRRGLAPGS